MVTFWYYGAFHEFVLKQDTTGRVNLAGENRLSLRGVLNLKTKQKNRSETEENMNNRLQHPGNTQELDNIKN